MTQGERDACNRLIAFLNSHEFLLHSASDGEARNRDGQ